MDTLTFIVGTGRCGSTALQRYLAQHYRIGWLSNLLTAMPSATWLHKTLLRLDRHVAVGTLSRGKLRPSETYPFWEHHVPGFAAPYRDLRSEDATARHLRTLRSLLPELVPGSRPNLLVKLTGWPRMGFLAEAFPEARFVHLLRDGRAVANSLVHVGFWTGWRGPANWKWGELTPDQTERWNEANQSFVALAGIEWEILVRAHYTALESLSQDRVLEVRYENLTSQPDRTISRILQHIGISRDRGGLPRPKDTFRTKNDRWRTDLTRQQQEELEGCIAPTLVELGYELVL